MFVLGAGMIALLFAIGVVGLPALAVGARGPWLMVLVAVVGVGTLGAQLVATVFAAALYPTPVRGSGVGWALGIGRLGGITAPVLGGAILGAGGPPVTLLVVFVGVAMVGLVTTLMVRVPSTAIPTFPPSPEGVGAAPR